MIGIVSHDFFSELSNREIEEGIAGEQRDHMLQVLKYKNAIKIVENILEFWYNEKYMQIFNQITFQTYVRNNYNAHLQEILLTLQNEYTDWEDSVQHPTSVRNQVNYIKLIFSYQNRSIII